MHFEPQFGTEFNRFLQRHWEGRTGHNEVWRRLATTRSSRLIREESLPVFYSINAFKYNRDTWEFFIALASHGRLNLLWRIQFYVHFYNEKHAQRVLKDMYYVLRKELDIASSG